MLELQSSNIIVLESCKHELIFQIKPNNIIELNEAIKGIVKL